jgi:ABC-type polysaccharide/polyol phosphate export permease
MNTATYISDFFVQAYGYREYLLQSVSRDLKTKYKRSFLGYIWTMLHPLAMMLIIAAVFSNIMRMEIEDYAVFLFCGLLPWNYFNSTAMMSLHSIRNNAKLFGQVAVPKYIFVLSLVSSNLVNFLLALVPLILVMLIAGRNVPVTAFALPIVLVPLVSVVIGVSLLLATLNVFFDDTLHLSEVAFQGLYFLCPILYFREVLPKNLINILVINPLFCQIEFMRDIFYFGRLPDPYVYTLNLGGSLMVLFFSLIIFKRNENKFLYFV